MKIIVNGTAREVPATTGVADLVGSLTGSTEGKGFAVAVNDAVVIRSQWAETRLEDGDTVEVITAVPGG